MPSPKAVLRDINDLKLDPKVAHSGTKASGRLKQSSAHHVAEPVPVHKEVVKPALVSLPTPPLPPPVVEIKVETPEVKGDGVTDDTAAVQALFDAQEDAPVKSEPVVDDATKSAKKKEKKANKPVEPAE